MFHSQLSRLARCGLLGALLHLAGPGSFALAASPDAEDGGVRDQRTATRARQAFAQDALLGPMTIGVSVRCGVVELWGAVPSAAAARRAEEHVRRLPGVLEVCNRLQVPPVDDPLTEFMALPARPLPELASRPPVPAPLSGPALLTSRWADSDGALDLPLPLGRDNGSGVSLLEPILMPAATPAIRAALPQTVERLRFADPRYRGLSVEVKEGIVRLGGVAARREDAMALAQAISKLPGVERVIVQEVRTGP